MKRSSAALQRACSPELQRMLLELPYASDATDIGDTIDGTMKEVGKWILAEQRRLSQNVKNIAQYADLVANNLNRQIALSFAYTQWLDEANA